MKIKIIFMSVVLPILTLGGIGVTCDIATKNDIKVEMVSNDCLDLPNNINNVPTIYINKDFTKKVISRSNNVQIDYLENNEENEIVDVKLELAASYDFTYEGLEYKGDIYANPFDDLSIVENKANEIIESIYNGTYFDGYNSNSRLEGDFEIGTGWMLLDEEKVNYTFTYEGEHFGDFSEWRSVFKLKNAKPGSSYYAFVNESYIKPEQKDTDYRTDDIIYKYDPTLGVKSEVRNYAPKMKNPSAEIGYSINAGAEAESNGGSTIKSEISTSYSTLVESPKVYDQGNMTKNYVEIKFDYLEPFKNSGQYYEYNISQTYQSSSFIMKTNDSSDDVIVKNDRTVSIQRDGFWSNRLVHFNTETKVTIIR